jgi:regulator of RNase E activity RraB
MSVCPTHNWEAYSYNTDNGLVVVGFHTDSTKVDQSKYPYCARVQISIKAANQHGGPSREEAQVLWDMEDRLVEALDAAGTECLLLGRLTHSGLRELVFQVADYVPFRPPVGRWMQAHASYETDVSEHDGWDFFFESVWPSENSWHLIFDRRVVDNLIKNGSDPAKPHSLEFVFRGNIEGLRRAQTDLTAKGYRLLEFPKEDARLIMAKSMPLDLSGIYSESMAHRNLCEQYGIEYDGWGASVEA